MFFFSLFFWGGVIGRFVAVSGFTQKHLIFFKLFAEKCWRYKMMLSHAAKSNNTMLKLIHLKQAFVIQVCQIRM